ncbi:MAG: hypothetical protein Q7J67_05260 [bacterium]|nr:hypothetical protein [bacterium]
MRTLRGKILFASLFNLLVIMSLSIFAEELSPGPIKFRLLPKVSERGCLMGTRGNFLDEERAEYPNLPHTALVDSYAMKEVYPERIAWFRDIVINFYKNGNFTSLSYYPHWYKTTVTLEMSHIEAFRDTIAGNKDNEIIMFAQAIKDWKIPIQLAYIKEFTGAPTRYNEQGEYDLSVNNPAPELFAESWRHIWNIFETEGANIYVDWLWAGAIYMPFDFLKRCYPGEKYVDTVGWDGGSYDGAEYLSDSHIRAAYLNFVNEFPGKPIALAEEKIGWEQQADMILHYKKTLKDYPAIKWAAFLTYRDFVGFGLMRYIKVDDRLTEEWDETRGVYLVPDDITDVYEPLGLNEYEAFSEFNNDDYFLKYIRLPLVTPTNEQKVRPDNGKITLKWLELRDAGYEIKWSQDPNFPVGNTQILNVTDTEVILDDYPVNSTLYWQVKATHLETGSTLAESEIYSFYVAPYELKEMIDQFMDNPAEPADMHVTYLGIPLGQTFKTGPGVTNISGIELLCRNAYYMSSVTSPTVSIYDSPAKSILLAHASIPGFSGDQVYKWRRWDIQCEGLTPETQYYMEITIPGDSGPQMSIKRDLSPDTYQGGDIYYTDYAGGMGAYSDDICFRIYTIKDSEIDQYLDWPHHNSSGVVINYYDQPIGQTFTTGSKVDNILGVEFLCASYYGAIADNPTVSLYDSPQKNVLLAQASIEGFGDRNFHWRKWNLHYDGLTPNTTYYLELTTPGQPDHRVLVKMSWVHSYSGGNAYYSDYNGDMQAYSACLHFKTYYVDNSTSVISYQANPSGHGIATQYRNKPIGQTFTTGDNATCIYGIALNCATYYSSIVTSPTITIYDSIKKEIQLAQASIKGFQNDRQYKWRYWPIYCDLIEPNKKYYFEVTTPGEDDPRMVIMTGVDGSMENNIVYADTAGEIGEYSHDLRFAVYTKDDPDQGIYGLARIESADFNGYVEKLTSIDLKWSGIQNARLYRVQYSSDPDFENTDVNTVKIGLSEYGVIPTEYNIEQPVTLGLGSLWYWRVYAEDIAGNIFGISPVYNFTVDNIYNEIIGPALEPEPPAELNNEQWRYKMISRDAAEPVLVRTQNFTTDPDMSILTGIELAISSLYSKMRVGKTIIEIEDIDNGQIIGSSIERESTIVEKMSAKWFRWQFASPLSVSPNKTYRIKLWMKPALLYDQDSAILVHRPTYESVDVYYRVYKIIEVE